VVTEQQDEEPVDSLTLAAQKRMGDVLNDKWRLDLLLGVGGMAAVYAATHRNGNRVAVKLLHPHCVVNDSIRSRFQREGYVANKIEHPGSVRVLDDDQTADGAVFLVMELLEGETLEARQTRRGRLPADEAISIAYHVLDVLAAAHAQGIVHRDIKLDNVFLTHLGQVKVLDFGIARLAESSQHQNVARTRTNAMMGTPAFMAPEQALARAHDVDAQTDIWAVGATLFKLLTGRNVHEAATLNEQLVHAATKPAPPLKSLLGEIPAQLGLVVDRALAFEKSARWPDARAMQEAMRPLMRTTPAGALPFVRPTSMLEASRSATVPAMASVAAPVMTGDALAASEAPARRSRAWIPLLLVAAVVAAGGGWYATRGQPRPPAVLRAEVAPTEGAGAAASAGKPGATSSVSPSRSNPAPEVPAAALGTRPAGDDARAAKLPAAMAKPLTEAKPNPAPKVHKSTRDKAKPRATSDDDMWDRRH
jgi:hypothetical protein